MNDGASIPPSAPHGNTGAVARLTEIDSLRGLAALMVVAFHYTFKYDELYHFAGNVPFQVSWGHLGVNLFFVISGFVIFLTLNRTRVPMDFVVSRASRLYPAYWTAILLTMFITHLLGLPGKEPSWQTAVLNVVMFQGLFRVPPVDGVYWTLQVELLFYAFALTLFVTRQMRRVLPAVCLLLLLRLIYWAVLEYGHVDLPWRIREILILDYIAFFALGIIAYRLVENRNKPNPGEWATAAFAIVVLSITESIGLAGVGLACFVAVWLAALGRLGFLRVRLLVWFGSISYPLYLLHENIGWAILRQLQSLGWTPTAAIVVTAVLVIALAAMVSQYVERPAMAWIRGKYRMSTWYREQRGLATSERRD
jgi:peptidoglycan/LPS O-acetylase OafA/YrhL